MSERTEHQTLEPLSPAGRNRRESMLDELLGELDRAHNVRVRRRRIGSAFAVLALALGAGLMSVLPRRGGAPASGIDVRIVATDPSAAAQWTIHSDGEALQRATTWPPSHLTIIEPLDDSQLLHALASIGRPTGLIRANGRTWLTDNVVDVR